MDAQQNFEKLLGLLQEATEWEAICGHLYWDEKTQCPDLARPGMADLKARAAKAAYQTFVTDEIGDLLSELKSIWGGLRNEQRLIVDRLIFSYKRSTALDADFVAGKERCITRAYAAWEKAKEEADFSLFKGHLQEVLKFTREEAERYGGQAGDSNSLYTALLQGYEPGMTTGDFSKVMTKVRGWLVPFLAKIRESEVETSDKLLRDFFPEDRQRSLAEVGLRTIGYDFDRGNLTKTTHPFMITVGPKDNRVTTRFYSDFLSPSLFGALHEGGHALYEQGLDKLMEKINVSGLRYSLGIHESQSRMWENMVGRSKPFWEYFFPILKAMFPQYGGVLLDDFYTAANIVKPSPIRVEADEVTYNLHILLRFECELGLVSGELSIEDLPDAFAQKMRDYIGYEPKNLAEGVLQDVHWGTGLFGYFPTYTFGNLAAAQLFNTFTKFVPDWQERFRRGKFNVLLEWLRENVQPFGQVKILNGLLEEVTGEPLNHQYWCNYIETKYSPLYKLK